MTIVVYDCQFFLVQTTDQEPNPCSELPLDRQWPYAHTGRLNRVQSDKHTSLFSEDL
jgi:hypothetical protein